MLQVTSKFQATVYGNTTDSPMIFDIMNFLHNAMLENEHDVFFDSETDENAENAEKQPKINMTEFMADLMYSVDRCYFKFEYFNQAEVESELESSIRNCGNFAELSFSINGIDYYFTDINEKIKNGAYN